MGQLFCFLAASSLCFGLGTAAAFAADAVDDKLSARTVFDMPAQALGVSLKQLADQAGIQILYEERIVQGLEAPALKARQSALQALDALLSNTGLEYTTKGDTVAVRKKTRQDSVRRPAREPVGTVDEGSLRFARNDTPRSSSQATASSEIAQDRNGRPLPSSEETDIQLEEIVVTGSRIRGQEAGASPFIALDRTDFAEIGATSIQQVMRTLPQNFIGGNQETGGVLLSRANAENLGTGAGINLRGLGNGSTLILLNGRRLPAAGFGAFVDVSTLPLSALERIEVLPDGASAIYGSDAIGGVVNFILRDDFEGAETALRYGSTTDGGVADVSASQLFGSSWETGSIMLTLDYGRRDPLLASDRDFAATLDIGGSNYLSPDEERWAGLIDGTQKLGDAFTLSATMYVDKREAANEIFHVNLNQTVLKGDTAQIGGTVELDWRLADWTLTLAQTIARSDIERTTAYFVGEPAQLANVVTADHELLSTQVDVEGPIFSLPGGEARLALGAEHREESLDVVRTGFGFGGTVLDRRLDGAYAEVFFPLVGERNQRAFAKRLELTAAVRYEDYDDVGDTTNIKLGAVWSPEEALKLRATYGTSFRAPYLYQFDTSLATGYLFDAPDPSSPTGRTILAALLATPSPDLGPEEAVTWTAGFDIDPEAFFGLSVNATYFSIDYEERIASANLTFAPFTDPAVQSLVAVPPDAEILSTISTLPPGQVVNDTSPLMPLSAVQATFDGRTRNQSRTEVSGIDLAVERSFDSEAGTLSAGVDATYFIEFRNQAVSNLPSVDLVNTVFNPIDLRFRAHLGWTSGSWSFNGFVNYADSYRDVQLPAVVGIDSWTTVDLAASYAFGERGRWTDGVTVQFNALNVLDEPPPRVASISSGLGDPGFDTENADPFGRIVSVQVKKVW